MPLKTRKGNGMGLQTGAQRCMRCKNPVAKARTPDGREVMRCTGCGTEWVSRPLDTKKPA